MSDKCRVVEEFVDTVQSMLDRLTQDYEKEHYKSCQACREEHDRLVAGVTQAYELVRSDKKES